MNIQIHILLFLFNAFILKRLELLIKHLNLNWSSFLIWLNAQRFVAENGFSSGTQSFLAVFLLFYTYVLSFAWIYGDVDGVSWLAVLIQHLVLFFSSIASNAAVGIVIIERIFVLVWRFVLLILVEVNKVVFQCVLYLFLDFLFCFLIKLTLTWKIRIAQNSG